MTPNQLINKSYLLYLLLFLFFLIFNGEYFPAYYNAGLQLQMLVCGFLFSKIALSTSLLSATWICIFSFQLISTICMRLVNIEFFYDWLGYNPIDAEYYRSIAEHFQNKDLTSLFSWFNNNLQFDDFGYPFFLVLTTSIFGFDYGLQVMVFINTLFILWGSKYLYRLSCFFTNQHSAKLVAILWGMMPFAVYTSAAGLKENFFVFFIIGAFYFYFKYKFVHKFQYLILSIIFALVTAFFRIPIAYMVIASFIVSKLFSSHFFRKHQNKIIIILIIIGIISFRFFASYIMQQRDLDFDQMSEIQDNKLQKNGGTIAVITNIIAALIGPFPSYIATTEKINYITLYSFSPFLKMLLSYFALYAVFKTLKQKQTILMPIIVFWALNSIMLIFTFFTLHDRYQWMHIPFVLLLAIIGIQKYYTIRHKIKYDKLYLFITIILIIFFNYR